MFYNIFLNRFIQMFQIFKKMFNSYFLKIYLNLQA
jgi:hypothetical protein